MLYSSVPVEPLVVADTDKEVVPPLHPIVPAMADAPVMLQGGAAITSIVEVAKSSAVLLPATEVPAAQVVPLPKFICP